MATRTYLDVETTALHLRRRPWEIAYIQETDGGDIRELLLHIVDVDLEGAEPEALKIGRFQQRHGGPRPSPRDADVDPILEAARIDKEVAAGSIQSGTIVAVDEATAARLTSTWLAGTHLVGLNTSFDSETLAWMLDRHDLPHEPWDYHLTNVANIAEGWLRARAQSSSVDLVARANRSLMSSAEPRFTATDSECLHQMRAILEVLANPPLNSAMLSRLCGVEPPAPEVAHTALADAVWVRDWDHMMRGPEYPPFEVARV